ncbi:cyclin-D6-1-like isoform X2 [Phragmites australis]|uniref:cyclin-D6-1-like isoform X2 n=1 Tax=Phragmites australis TaxID=29695 RepID=UPI002D793010|nr:cyclin-D6-1-like isoform X2 [Phragmites australis]
MAGEREQEEDAYEYEFDLENPFTSPADEPIASLLDAGGHHSPSVTTAASAARRDAAGFIAKVRFGGELAVHPRVAYLALNYVDRFLSKRQLPFEQQTWAPRLLAISCLSLSAKMQRVAAFSIADIQRDEEFMFDAATIRRMERVVLGALEWRARSVTPLAFLGFFLTACYPPPRHPPQVAAVKARAVDLLLRAQPEVKMAEFSPSVAAAAALLTATGEVAAANLPAFQAGVAACPFVNSEELRECGEVMAAACGVGPGWAAASGDTPVTVLGYHRSASSASESNWTVGSAANGGGDAKKRCMGPPSQWG